jgi:hypothetical protein
MRANFSIVISIVATSVVAPRAFARKPLSEEAQRRALLEQLAAASAEIPPQEKTDADLMYAAMRQWRGEPRGSAAVDKVLAQSKKDIGHDRKEIEDRVRSSFWKDPFSREVVPVRKEDRDLLHDHAARVARAHGQANDEEIARLRADLSTVRAENARLRAEVARLEESGGGGDAEAQAESVGPSRHLHARRSEAVRAPGEGSYLEAMSAPAPAPRHHHHRAKPAGNDAAVASAPTEAPVAPAAPVTGPPAGWQSSDPRGIIVVPIEAPVPIHADKPSKRVH